MDRSDWIPLRCSVVGWPRGGGGPGLWCVVVGWTGVAGIPYDNPFWVLWWGSRVVNKRILRFDGAAAYVLLLSLLVNPMAGALDQRGVVQGLEALGEWEAAYPLALDLARTQDDYPAWRRVATDYALYDLDAEAYQQAWQQTRAIDNPAVYRDFITIRPGSPSNRLAIHRIYELTRELDTVSGYQAFMQEFPDSVEAVAALLRVHELSFARARDLDEPAVYDAFVALFPDARQVPDAIEAAYQAERRALEKKAEGGFFDLRARFYADEHRARIARRLFNAARRAEKAGQRLVADRKFRLLELPLFADSAALTEHLDRDERQAWQQRQRQSNERATALQRQLGDAVVAAVEAQGQRVATAVNTQGRRVAAAIDQQGNRLEAAIREHNRVTRARFEQVYETMDRGLSKVATQVNSQLADIGMAIRERTETLNLEAKQARYQQERLFTRAQDEARSQAYRSRRCAAELARNGKERTFFSDCR